MTPRTWDGVVGTGKYFLSNNDLGQQLDRNRVNVVAHPEEANPYFLLRNRINYIRR